MIKIDATYGIFFIDNLCSVGGGGVENHGSPQIFYNTTTNIV